MSRCALQQHLLTEDVKVMFMKILRRTEYFSGVKVVNYCVMDNHFHLLLEVPERLDVDDASLDDRITVLYGAKKANSIFHRWKELNDIGSQMVVEKERDAFRKRMFDLSEFMKTFKQRFSLWYCTNHGNLEGTIWQGPFHSVLVEGQHDALAAISAYITLNPVRAGIVENARDYAWSGYGAAANGDRAAKIALLSAYGGSAANAAKWNAYKAMIMMATTGHEAEIGRVPEKTRTSNTRSAKPTASRIVGNGNSKAVPSEISDDGNGQIQTLIVMRRRERKVSRGVAFGSKGFVTGVIRKASQTEEVLTYPQAFCVGERNAPLYCAGRRGA